MMFAATTINSGVANSSNPLPPAVATAAGFTRLALYDDFVNLNGIDVNSTDIPNYLWYPGLFNRPGWDGTTFSTMGALFASGFTQQSASVLRITPNATGTQPTAFRGMLSTTLDPTNTTFVGKVFPNGCYAEAKLRFDPTLVNNTYPAGFGSWVSFVFTLKEGFLSNPSQVPFTELDFWEALPTGGTGYNNVMSVNYITQLNGSGLVSTGNNNNGVSLSNGDGNFHTYAVLWQTMAQNGGTGSIRRYFDGAELTAARVTYDNSGSPQMSGSQIKNIEGQNNILVIYPGANGWYVDVDYVQVWTA